MELVLTKYGVGWVHGHLVLGSISDQSLSVCKGHIAGCGPVPLVIGYDLYFSMLEDAHTGVCGAQVNTNCWSFRHLLKEKKYRKKISPLFLPQWGHSQSESLQPTLYSSSILQQMKRSTFIGI